MLKSWIGAVPLYALFAAVVGYFSINPDYQYRDPDEAVLKLSVNHHGDFKEPCQELSPEEVAKLPPNMRRTRDCPRERWPVAVELSVDGAIVFSEMVAPTGLSGDGSMYAYERMPIPAGEHEITFSVRDSQAEGVEPRVHSQRVRLEPGQVLVVEFLNNAFTFTTG